MTSVDVVYSGIHVYTKRYTCSRIYESLLVPTEDKLQCFLFSIENERICELKIHFSAVNSFLILFFICIFCPC